MERCSAWKFINPPFAFVQGVLVDAQGVRVCNEDVYGATLADRLIQAHEGKGWLLYDEHIRKAAEAAVGNADGELQEDQVMSTQCLPPLFSRQSTLVQDACPCTPGFEVLIASCAGR